MPSADSARPRAQTQGVFGKVAIELGYITAAQLEEAVKVQAASLQAGFRRHLGEILIKKGYLTEEQIRRILKSQTVSRKIGEYELISKLGAGAMGSVYKARQLTMEREIALKILSPERAKNQEFRDRFVREARAVAKLNHPHIVHGIDVGEADGYWYFAMEYVDGGSLGQLMQRLGGRLPEAKALEFARQIAQALQHAHSHNILHRDVKPDNILLDKSCQTAKLVDLGLARAAESDDDPGLTQPGLAVGTPYYISPEQARGRTDLTPATDLYSLGATLFHLLAGQTPFEGATAAAIMTRHLTDPVPSPRAVNPDISLGADRIIMKLMQKSPEDRYPDAMQLARDIERVQKGDTLERLQAALVARKSKAGKGLPVAGGGGLRAASGTAKEWDERERPGSGSGPARALRRRRDQRQSISLGSTLLLVALLGVLLVFLLYQRAQPIKPRPALPQAPAPAAQGTRTTGSPQPGQRLPLAVPAFLQTQPDGRRLFRTDFEGKVENFDVAPLVAKTEQCPAVVTDVAGRNHVLRLASIRQPHRAAPNEEPAGVMARLLLPSDLVLSAQATLSVKVYFGKCADPDPELRVFWDNKTQTTGPDGKVSHARGLSCWTLKDPAFKTGWVKIQLQLGKSHNSMGSTQFPDAMQYISFTAGKPDENIQVFIDDLELADGGPAAEGSTGVPARVEEKESPVAPPPKKATPKTGEEGPLHRAL